MIDAAALFWVKAYNEYKLSKNLPELSVQEGELIVSPLREKDHQPRDLGEMFWGREPTILFSGVLQSRTDTKSKAWLYYLSLQLIFIAELVGMTSGVLGIGMLSATLRFSRELCLTLNR